MYSKGDNYERLTWLDKATSNTFFIRIKISIFPSTKAVCDPGNSPDVLRRSFGEIIKSKITLARLKGIEPRKFLWGRWFHLLFNEDDEKAYHLNPLKYGQVVMVQYPNEVRM